MSLLWVRQIKIFIFLLLSLGSGWIFTNIFYLPFAPWTEGLYRPWLVIQGLVPYRDFWWDRGPLDLYFLSGIYRIFGVNNLTYQITIFSILLATSLLIFFGLLKKSLRLALLSYVVYVALIFPLFINSEIEELLVGLFSLLVFYFTLLFVHKKKLRFLFFSGVISGLSYMTKQTSGLLIAVSILYLLTFESKKRFYIFSKKKIINVFTYVLGILLPVGIMLACLFLANGFLGYLHSQYFTFFIYSKWAKPWGIGEGWKIILVFFSILVPFIFIRTDAILNRRLKLFLILLTLSLFTCLLPSYWTYRLVAAFPLFAIAFALYIFDSLYVIKSSKNITKKVTIFSSWIIFIIFFGYFLNQYIDFVNANGFQKGQYILDYGENEKKTAQWLVNNTVSNEKIFNMGNNIIMVRAKRLPQNKYVGSMPIDYMPFKESSKIIESNPPRVIVFQETLLSDWPELKNWEFINYLKTKYIVKEKFGDISIYVK